MNIWAVMPLAVRLSFKAKFALNDTLLFAV